MRHLNHHQYFSARVGWLVLGILFFFLLLVFLKVNINSRNEYQRAESALQNNNLEQAITHFNRAIHWYSPGNRSVKNSIQELWRIGTQAEENGDYGLALQAFRALRSSLYSARSFYTPYPDWIEKCDDRISTILTRKTTPDEDSPTTSLMRKKDILKILKTPTEPSVFWSIIVEIGFLGWIVSSIGFIFRVFTEQKGFNPKRALVWGILIIFFYTFWIVGMLNA